jgi:hypothetical protein
MAGIEVSIFPIFLLQPSGLVREGNEDSKCTGPANAVSNHLAHWAEAADISFTLEPQQEG